MTSVYRQRMLLSLKRQKQVAHGEWTSSCPVGAAGSLGHTVLLEDGNGHRI